MAGPVQYYSHFLPYTPTATTAAVGYEPVYLADWNGTHPLLRTWRSTVITQTDIFLDMGGVKNIQALALRRCNFATVQLAHAATLGGVYTNLTGSPFTITRDLHDPNGYAKLFVAQSVSDAFVRIRIPAQTPTDGAAYFEVGGVDLTDTLVTLTKNIDADMGSTYDEPGYQVEGNGWFDWAPAGPAFADFSPKATLLNDLEIADWQTLRLLGRQARISVYYNQDKPEQVYLWQRNQPVPMTWGAIYKDVSTGWRTIA